MGGHASVGLIASIAKHVCVIITSSPYTSCSCSNPLGGKCGAPGREGRGGALGCSPGREGRGGAPGGGGRGG